MSGGKTYEKKRNCNFIGCSHGSVGSGVRRRKNVNSAAETKVEQNVPETENMEEENLHVQDENTANETEFDSRLAGEWYVTSDTFCQGCLRTFFAVIQNQTLDFVAHGFFARFTEMDFDAVDGLSDFLYHYRWRGFLYGQRGSGCGGAAVAGVVVHRLSFP